jgi:hypothetical protein
MGVYSELRYRPLWHSAWSQTNLIFIVKFLITYVNIFQYSLINQIMILLGLRFLKSIYVILSLRGTVFAPFLIF